MRKLLSAIFLLFAFMGVSAMPNAIATAHATQVVITPGRGVTVNGVLVPGSVPPPPPPAPVADDWTPLPFIPGGGPPS